MSFIEYTKLPGIINDRLHIMFSESYNKTQNSPESPKRLSSPNSAKRNLEEKKKNDYVTEKSFVKNFTCIFIGDLDSKIRFTFNMYDFDNDGLITPEDIRIMMSYMPFK